MKLREKICKLLLPKDSKIVKKDVLTIDDLIKTQDVECPSLNLIPSIPITKEMVESISKQFPESEQPTIIESDGKIVVVGTEGDIKRDGGIALLSIVPIPYISVDSVDMEKYSGGGKEPKIVSLDDIEGAEISMPPFSVVPMPFLLRSKT